MTKRKSTAKSSAPAAPTMVPLFYTGGGRARVVGEVTGTVYRFPEGRALLVDERDVEALLAMTRTGGCCGRGRKSYPIFARG